MDLLQDIISGAIDDSVRLPVVLRKCRVLAGELQNEALREWVVAELNGYGSTEGLPPYRVITTVAKGLFLGGWGAQINDQPIAPSGLEPEHRWWATTAHLTQSVAAYESLIEGNSGGTLLSWWPADLVAYYQSKLIQGYALNRAWQDIPRSAIVDLLDAVRNRLLEFALELREKWPEAPLEEIPAEQVQSAVTTIIYGGTNIIAPHGSGTIDQRQQTVIMGDFNSLSAELVELGVPTSEIAQLHTAIEADKAEGAERGFGERTRAWLSKAITYVGKGTGKVVGAVATAALTEAVNAYFGVRS